MKPANLPLKVGNKSFPSLLGALLQVKPEKTTPKKKTAKK